MTFPPPSRTAKTLTERFVVGQTAHLVLPRTKNLARLLKLPGWEEQPNGPSPQHDLLILEVTVTDVNDAAVKISRIAPLSHVKYSVHMHPILFGNAYAEDVGGGAMHESLVKKILFPSREEALKQILCVQTAVLVAHKKVEIAILHKLADTSGELVQIKKEAELDNKPADGAADGAARGHAAEGPVSA